MAVHESDREDLLREATALVRRAEIVARGYTEPVLLGFRKDGSLSAYFGSDPVYHLDPQGRLKRAFHSGRHYRSQGDGLAELTRERTPTATVLRRRDLPEDELGPFLAQMIGRITNLVVQWNGDAVRIERQVPPADATFRADFEAAAARMNANSGSGRLLAPRYRGKR